MTDTIHIGIADDQLLFRQGIGALIQSEPGFSLVLDAENGIDCMEKLQAMPVPPHIILADMEMPEMDGMELNENIQKKYPGIKLIVLSVHSGERLIARMIQEGASGYLLKNCDKAELVTAIRTVFSSGFYINNNVLEAIQRTSNTHTPLPKNINGIPVELSAREKEILQLICKQYSTAEIAAQLFLSARTVEGHRNNLLQKTGCRNTAGLVLFAVKYNIYKVIF
jgi:two-component system, NarL family, response regulator DegU